MSDEKLRRAFWDSWIPHKRYPEQQDTMVTPNSQNADKFDVEEVESV